MTVHQAAEQQTLGYTASVGTLRRDEEERGYTHCANTGQITRMCIRVEDIRGAECMLS